MAPTLTPADITDRRIASRENGDGPLHGVFEPPRSRTVAAIVAHKWLICVCAVVLALAGAAYGLSRPRTYTSSATLQVGQVNPNSPGFFGYVQSAASLATAFSRAIDAEPVLASVEHKLHVTPAQAIERLSASPIPTSPAFRVIATGPSERSAVALANATAGAVIVYEAQSNSTNPQAEALLHEYRRASLELRRAVATVAKGSHGAHGYSAALAAAEAQKNAASVRLSAIGEAYTSAIATRGPSTGLLSLLAGAAGASDDRSASAQKYGLIGLFAGLLLGALLAVGLERRRGGRASSEPETAGAQRA